MFTTLLFFIIFLIIWYYLKNWINYFKSGDPKENASIITSIFNNEDQGPKRDIVALNAAAGFVISGIADDIGHGLEIALRTITDGIATTKLNSLREFK